MVQRLPANVPAQPFGQQQQLRQAKVRSCGVRLGMEAARDDLDGVTGAGEERLRVVKGKRRSSVRDCEYLGPSLLFNDIPATRWLGQIAQREARFLVCASPDIPR